MKFFITMRYKLLSVFLFLGIFMSQAQTKVGGHVFDGNNESVAFANIIFKGSSEGTITNENGRFYLESDETWNTIIISFIGYETIELSLESKVNLDLKLILNEAAAQLDAVLLVTGKQSKKNNPAIDILRKVWANKRENGLKRFKQYEYDFFKIDAMLFSPASVIVTAVDSGKSFRAGQLDNTLLDQSFGM